MIQTYHKIETVYKRQEIGKHELREGDYANPVVEYLKDNQWQFTEKVDGTNTRVYWNGYSVFFSGKTDNADMPKHLLSKLELLFGGETNEQVFEQQFGEKEVIIFGEGYGQKIQKCGKLYSDETDFIVFDVMVDGIYLERENVIQVASYFNLNVVPIVKIGTIQDGVDYIKTKPKSAVAKYDLEMEGIVGVPEERIYGIENKRIIIKIKWKDFS